MEAKKTTAAKTTVKKATPAKTVARSTAKKTTKPTTAASRTKAASATTKAKSTIKTAVKPATTKKAEVKEPEQTKPESREADTTPVETNTVENIAGSVKETIEKGAHTVGDTGKDILDIGGDIVSSAYGYAVKAIASAKKPIKGLVSKLTFGSNVDELLKWTELHEKGVISKEELEAKKNKLI